MIQGAREQQAAGKPLEGKTPASSQFERVQQVAEAGQHGDILIASPMKDVKRLIMLNKKQVNMDTGLEEKATLKTELEEVREALGRRDTEVS